MKHFLLFLSIHLFTLSIFSQNPSFEWSRRWVNDTQGTDVDVDSEGNVYLISFGNQTTNFNPNAGNILGPTSGCAAVTKLDSNGSTIWIKFIEVTGQTSGEIIPSNIVVKNGSIYVTGVFGGGGGVFDFDPGFGTATSTGLNPTLKGFIFKWDLDGNYTWHKTFTTSLGLAVKDLFVETNGNILICGSFNQTLNSNPFSLVSNGGGDCFFMKLDSMGNTLLMKSFGGVASSTDEALGICSNMSGEIYLTGKFRLSVDFDPGPGETILTSLGSDDAFISKFNVMGELVWAHTIGSTNLSDTGSDIILDENENLVFTGTTTGTVDFDPSDAIFNLNSLINYAFIAKWTPDASFLWAKGIYSDEGAQGKQLSIQNSKIALGGICSGITDFDPTNNDVFITSTGGIYNTFILSLNSSGQYLWAGILNNLNGYFNNPTGLTQSSESTFLCGEFQGTMNSNPLFNQSSILNSLTNNSGVPNTSNFIIKLEHCIANAETQNINACSSYTWPINNQTYTVSGIYTETIPNGNGCDSIYTLNLNFNLLELCDGADNDCDGLIDNGFDIDGDGVTTCNGDCDDTNANVYPGADELCNDIDENCNNTIDEGFDLDNDNYTTCNGDCDDTNASVYPGALELCNNIDENCNNEVDEGFDLDNDNYTTCNGDCDDTNASVYPGALELCNDIDENCNNEVDEGFDLDNDNYTTCNGDCDDTNANIYPGALELCNDIDENCNNEVDEGFDLDNDNYTTCNGDCDDTNANIYPGAIEILDLVDNNCDDQIDEGFDPDLDEDDDGFSPEDGDCNDDNPDINPDATEQCNGIDDNCNSSIDEGFDLDGDGETTCAGDCNDNDPLVNTIAIELCNSVDDDCDTYINEDLTCDDDSMLVPNGISPNGDGINDAWYLPWLNGMNNYSIVISNRWGQVVFQSTEYSTPWEGTYLGNPLPPADYFYLIKLSNNTIFEGVISIKY